MPRVLGIDYGKAYIGLAISDETQMIATPYGVIANVKFAAVVAQIGSVVKEFGIDTAVLGLPMNMDGSMSAMGQAVKQFAKNLEKELGLQVIMQDERMSTNAVERAMLEADLSRQKRKAKKDSAAAAYILQGWLDYR
jgi:putative Holliday junction resolvase